MSTCTPRNLNFPLRKPCQWKPFRNPFHGLEELWEKKRTKRQWIVATVTNHNFTKISNIVKCEFEFSKVQFPTNFWSIEKLHETFDQFPMLDLVKSDKKTSIVKPITFSARSENKKPIGEGSDTQILPHNYATRYSSPPPIYAYGSYITFVVL